MKEGPEFRRTAEEERLELLRIPQTAHAFMDIEFKPSTQKFKLNAYDCAVVSGHSAGRNIVCVAELNFPAGLDLEWAPFFTERSWKRSQAGPVSLLGGGACIKKRIPVERQAFLVVEINAISHGVAKVING